MGATLIYVSMLHRSYHCRRDICINIIHTNLIKINSEIQKLFVGDTQAHRMEIAEAYFRKIG
jgi:hypothetical protein